MLRASSGPRHNNVTRRARDARSIAAWPAEFAAPTTTTSSPSISPASAGDAP